MPLQPLRCVFVTIPPLLSAILTEALSRRVELQLIAQLPGRDGLPGRLEALSPDLAVIGLGADESDEIGPALLARLPLAKILLISDGANRAYVHEMLPHREVLSDFSPDALLAAILHSSGPTEMQTDPAGI